MANIKKFLDSDGLTILCRKFQDYPDNEILGTVINAIDNIKVNKVEGKDLSTNDYTNEDKEKLNSSITFNEQTLAESQQAQARANIGAGTSDFSGSYNDLSDKPIEETEDDAMEMLAEMGILDPITDEKGNVLTDENGNVLTI